MARVLYIDDELDILELAAIYFAEQGIEIDTASDAKTGLELASANTYKIIISDARMPGMKGLEFYQILREKYQFPGHFILVSGHYEGHETHKLPSGIAFLLTKPIEFDDLIAKVSSLLK